MQDEMELESQATLDANRHWVHR